MLAHTLQPGQPLESEWRYGQVLQFTLRNAGTRPLLVRILEDGNDFHLRRMNVLPGDELGLGLALGAPFGEWLALTASEAAGFSFQLLDQTSDLNQATVRIEAQAVADEQHPAWRFARAMMHASLYQRDPGQDMRPAAWPDRLADCAAGAGPAEDEGWARQRECAAEARHWLERIPAGDQALVPVQEATAASWLLTARLALLDRLTPLAREAIDQALAAAPEDSLVYFIALSRQAMLADTVDGNQALAEQRNQAIVEQLAVLADDEWAKQSLAVVGYWAALNRCLAIHRQHRLDDAEQCYQRLSTRWAMLGEQRAVKFMLLNNQAGLSYDRGLIGDAAAVWESALEDPQQLSAYGRILFGHNLGLARWRQRRVDEAIPLLETAIAEFLEIGEHTRVYWARYYLASMFRDLGQFQRAEQVYLQALESARTLESAMGQYRITSSLARLHSLQQRHGLAAQEYRAALDEYRQLPPGQQTGNGTVLLSMAEMLLEQGETGEVAGLLAEAAQQPDVSSSGRSAAWLGLLRGQLDLVRQQPAEAVADFSMAMQRFHDSGDLQYEALTRAWLARGLAQSGSLEAGLAEAAAARAQLRDVRAEVISTDLRASLADSWREVFDAEIHILLDQWRMQPSTDLVASLLISVEQAKAQSLREGGLTGERLMQLPKAVREQRRQLVASLNGAESSLMASRRVEGEDILRQDLQRRVASQRSELEAFDRQHALLDTALDGETHSLADLQQAIGPAQRVVSYYRLGGEYLRFVLSGNSVELALLDAARVDRLGAALLESWRQVPSAATGAVPARGTEAQTMVELLLPAWPALEGVEQLLLAPDGSLWQLPFAALPAGPAGQDQASYLGQVLALSYSVALLAKSQASDPQGQAIRVFADPVYQASDPRLLALAGSTASPPPESASELVRLRGSGAEARWLRNNMAGPVTVLEGLEASREQVLNDAGQREAVWHFAVHGVFDDSVASIGGLAMSRFAADGRPQAYLLSRSDIEGSWLPVDLVFLSACDTGSGEVLGSEGVVGLTRAFLMAGSGGVINTAWTVDDTAGIPMMAWFYSAFLEQKKAPAVALQSAIHAMIESGRYADPYYWAGYSLHRQGL